MAKVDAGPVLDRLQKIAGVKSDIALSAYLGIGKSSVGSWRARGRVPFEECVDLAIRKGLDLNWLLLGVGEPYSSSSVRDAAAAYLATERAADARMHRMAGFLAHWNATRNEDDKAWLEMQLARAVPEYAEWVAARGKH